MFEDLKPCAVNVPPITKAAAFAGTMALSVVSAERGAVLPSSNSLAFLHPNEMVLPSGISQGLQSMIKGGGSGGGFSGQFVQHNNFKGSHNLTKTQLQKHGKTMGSMAMQMIRNNSLKKAWWM